MGNSPGMSHIPREYYGNGNAIFKAEIVIFPGMGFSRGMGMRPHGNGNSRTSHISALGITGIKLIIKIRFFDKHLLGVFIIDGKLLGFLLALNFMIYQLILKVSAKA